MCYVTGISLQRNQGCIHKEDGIFSYLPDHSTGLAYDVPHVLHIKRAL